MKLSTLLFSPRGQINRLQLLKGFLLAWALAAFFVFAPSLICPQFPEIFSTKMGKISIAISYITGVVLFFYSVFICLSCKRLRDMGYSAWWFILACIPYLQPFYLILFFYPGQKKMPVFSNVNLNLS